MSTEKFVDQLSVYRIAELPERLPWGQRVQDELLERAKRDDDLELPFVAMSLGLTARTLQRRLSQEGTVFFVLRDQVRLHLAVDALFKTDRKLDDIAVSLGYLSRTSLTQAVKRRLGQSPQQLRTRFKELD